MKLEGSRFLPFEMTKTLKQQRDIFTHIAHITTAVSDCNFSGVKLNVKHLTKLKKYNKSLSFST